MCVCVFCFFVCFFFVLFCFVLFFVCCVGGRWGVGVKALCSNTKEKKKKKMFVGWLFNVPATRECISGTGLLTQFEVLPH